MNFIEYSYTVFSSSWFGKEAFESGQMQRMPARLGPEIRQLLQIQPQADVLSGRHGVLPESGRNDSDAQNSSRADLSVQSSARGSGLFRR